MITIIPKHFHHFDTFAKKKKQETMAKIVGEDANLHQLEADSVQLQVIATW